MTSTRLPAAPAALPVRGSLSPSRAADFLACPLLYRFRVLDRLPRSPSLAATRGTLVHAVLDRLFDLPAARRTPAAAAGLLEPEWQRMRAADPGLDELFEPAGPTGSPGPAGTPGPAGPAGSAGSASSAGSAARAAPTLAAWLSSARGLLAGYFTLEDPQRLEPAERETRVEAVLAFGLRLRGFVDRVDTAPGGAVRIVDYKTGRSPGAAHEARALFQLRFYALVLWRARRDGGPRRSHEGVVPRLLQLLYLGDRVALRYAPDEADLRATERKVLAVWQAVERATATGDWRPQPGRGCAWCEYQMLCPAFGGTPPPLPVQLSLLGPSPPALLFRDEVPPAAAGRQG